MSTALSWRSKAGGGSTHGACSSVALAGFALPECPGSSSAVYPALESLAAVVHCGLVPPPSRVRPSMCTLVTPAVPYLLLGLQDVQWAVGNSRGACKLARTPHVNQKKKKSWRRVLSLSKTHKHTLTTVTFYIYSV